jgi:hypothetical protein
MSQEIKLPNNTTVTRRHLASTVAPIDRVDRGYYERIFENRT